MTNMIWANRAFAMMLFVVAVVSCDRAPAPPQTLVWDFSEDNQLARVGLPAGIKEKVWYVDGPGTLRVKAKDGIERAVPFWFAQVWHDGTQVGGVRIMLEPGNTEQVYADAIMLADQWQLPDRKGLEHFRKFGDRMIGQSHYPAGSAILTGVQPRRIEIRASFAGAKKPWYAVLVLNFGNSKDPATAPPTQNN